MGAWGPGTAATYIGSISGIYTGYLHTCGVTTAGEGLCWGKNDDGQTNVPVGYKWSVITAGDYHSCGVTEDGTGMCWGKPGTSDNPEECINDFPSGNVWAVIWAGGSHCCGVTSSGGALCWGSNSYSKVSGLPSGQTWAEMHPGGWVTLSLKVDGTADGWGYNQYGVSHASSVCYTLVFGVTAFLRCGITSQWKGV